jgi:protein-S-isoprenylcysteine O-methyltransferase Ste14
MLSEARLFPAAMGRRRKRIMFRRVTAFIYGVACYAVSLACFAYLAGFIENFGVPKALDSAAEGPFITALAINSALLVLFGLQHSIMARPGFKAIWTRIVPEVAERSTYLLFSCLALFVLFWKWQPMGGVIWNVESHYGRIALYSLYAIGWGIVLLCTFLINHFDLFGLRQVWLYLTGKPYTSLAFRTPGPYRVVRHPLYVGWITVFWAAPTMTSAHLVFAVLTTAYILIAIQFEERDLVRAHGEYAEYRRRVPMIIPGGASNREVKVTAAVRRAS